MKKDISTFSVKIATKKKMILLKKRMKYKTYNKMLIDLVKLMNKQIYKNNATKTL